MTEKLEALKVNVMLLDNCLERRQAIRGSRFIVESVNCENDLPLMAA